MSAAIEQGDLLGEPTGPKRSRKKPTDDAGFDEFWSRYPRCIDKEGTARAYRRAITRGHTHERIMAGLAIYPFNSNPKFIPLSSTWLNQNRWEGIVVRQPPTVEVKPSKVSWRDKYDGGIALKFRLPAFDNVYTGPTINGTCEETGPGNDGP